MYLLSLCVCVAGCWFIWKLNSKHPGYFNQVFYFLEESNRKTTTTFDSILNAIWYLRIECNLSYTYIHKSLSIISNHEYEYTNAFFPNIQQVVNNYKNTAFQTNKCTTKLRNALLTPNRALFRWSQLTQVNTRTRNIYIGY